MKREQGGAFRDLLAAVHEDFNSSASLNWIFFACTPGAQPPASHTDGKSVEFGDHAICIRVHSFRVLCGGQRGIRIATLGADHGLPGVHCTAILQSFFHVSVVISSQIEHFTG